MISAVMMKMAEITLGLSAHRPEMIAYISDQMWRHAAIFLEEPPAAGFDRMLTGEMDIDEYLLPLDVEYPDFSSRQCRLLQRLAAAGKFIFQVEPYLEVLIGIHEFFAAGNRPDQIEKGSIQYPVYVAEKNATSALLMYYQTAATASFEDTIAAVERFAQMDAARFRLRDNLRAQELRQLLAPHSSAYIEAGEMHYPLWRMLKQTPGSIYRPRLVFLAEIAAADFEVKQHLYGPGDRLTLLYIFHPNTKQTERTRLLAARSLIHSKIVQKEEIADGTTALPHLRDEMRCNRIVSQLSLADCRDMFQSIRRLGTGQAHQIVADLIDSRNDDEAKDDTHTI